MRNCLLTCLLLALFLSACDRSTSPPPPLDRQPPTANALDLLDQLDDVTIPPRDLADLTERLTGSGPIPRTAVTTPTSYKVGDIATFWYKDQDAGQNVTVEAQLRYRSAELYMWFETGMRVRDDELTEAVNFLEAQLLPTHRAFFGEENRPGIDGDPRVHILHLEEIGGIAAAYFNSADGYVQAVNPYSNEREILYISMKSRDLGSDEYFGSVAQEMQHLIHQNTDPNEAAWLNEGMSELSLHLNGLEPNREADYAAHTDIQLTNLTYDPDLVSAHYAAAFLFTNYFREQYGEAATQALNRDPGDGLQGFDHLLAALGTGLSADDFFKNWLVANYLVSIERPTGVWGYETVDLPALELAEDHRRFPAEVSGSVAQYGADFIRLRGDEPLRLNFTGSQRVPLLATSAHSGSAFWSTLPADKSDMTLTGRFDLTPLTSATLSFWTWFDIEEGWDYAYLAVSADDGASWELLETDAMTSDDPQGNSFGPAFTGSSGGGVAPVWIQQEADLTPFAGHEILVRFEYVTDDAIHLTGFAVDDVTIPELAFSDDMES
ncbi:MAG: immune inhibitor A, partial [Anaerolineales bacterium]|nr:immune inhibitor A [Anaerolineales bacterium]